MLRSDAIAEALRAEISEYLIEDLNLLEDEFDMDIVVDADDSRCRVYVDVVEDRDPFIQRRHQQEGHLLQERLADNLPGVRALVMFSKPATQTHTAYAQSLYDVDEEDEDDLASNDTARQYQDEGLSLVEYDEDEDELRSIEELEDDADLYEEQDDDEELGEEFAYGDDEEEYVPEDGEAEEFFGDEEDEEY